ncbi:winged helix-turn-helix domain-containing protein [Blautia parvula]
MDFTPDYSDEGNVTAHIGHIRKKIELDPRNPAFIQTVRGIGYKFAKK